MKARSCLLIFAIVGLMLALQGCYELGFPPPRAGSVSVGPRGTQVSVLFSDSDRRIIHDYYAASARASDHEDDDDDHDYKYEKKTPPGLAKKETLPPGLQKRLERGQPLPPGLQRRGLPGDLEKRLPPLPRGYTREIVGADLLIWDVTRGVIADIIHDVITR